MSEREKLDEVVAAQTFAAETEQRMAYAYKQRESENIHKMREKLGEIVTAFAPKVVVTIREEPSSSGLRFIIDIGDGLGWLRRPFAGLEVRAWGNGFSVFDRFAESRSGYPVTTGSFDTVDRVAAVIRDAGAAYIGSRGEYPRHRPEWLDVLLVLNTWLIVVAIFALCVLIWGWNGTFYGGVAGWFSFYVSRAMGVWSLLVTAVVAYLFMR